MTGQVDLQKYTDWFVWARENLNRELDPTHAAAEAAYRSATSGGSDDDAHAAARAAGTDPDAVDPATMALAEWAAWALGTGRFRPEQGFIVARHALAEVEANHDLDATIDDVLQVAPPVSGANAAVGNRRPGRNALIVAGAVAGLLVVGAVTAGIIIGISSQGSSPPTGKPAINASISATMLPTGSAVVYASGLPPTAPVYLFVDNEMVRIGQTDSAGSFQATVPFPFGAHSVSVCLDEQHTQCPASTFISRDQ